MRPFLAGLVDGLAHLNDSQTKHAVDVPTNANRVQARASRKPAGTSGALSVCRISRAVSGGVTLLACFGDERWSYRSGFQRRMWESKADFPAHTRAFLL